MEDYGKFLEMVNEIKNIAVTQGGKLTKEEILSYLGDMRAFRGTVAGIVPVSWSTCYRN